MTEPDARDPVEGVRPGNADQIIWHHGTRVPELISRKSQQAAEPDWVTVPLQGKVVGLGSKAAIETEGVRGPHQRPALPIEPACFV